MILGLNIITKYEELVVHSYPNIILTSNFNTFKGEDIIYPKIQITKLKFFIYMIIKKQVFMEYDYFFF